MSTGKEQKFVFLVSKVQYILFKFILTLFLKKESNNKLIIRKGDELKKVAAGYWNPTLRGGDICFLLSPLSQNLPPWIPLSNFSNLFFIITYLNSLFILFVIIYIG